MNAIIPIGLGGFLGALARYYVSYFIQKLSMSSFPYGTFMANMSGCFFIGFVMRTAGMKPSFSPELRLFLVTGFTGAYTTFSTFEYETLQLMLASDYKNFFYNIFFSNLFGVASVLAGMAMSRIIFSQERL